MMKASNVGYFQELVERIQAFVREIEAAEQEHGAAQCVTYAPGRCPACFKVRQIEQERIERVIFNIEDEFGRLFEGTQEPDAFLVLEMTAILAKADVARCHPRGQWPRSMHETQEVQMILWPMIKHRLEINKLPQERQEQLLPLFKQVVVAYQHSYHEACLQRWPLEHFEYYNSPLHPGMLPAYFR